MLRYEVLAGLPPYGPMAVPFGGGGWTGSWVGHSEGTVVRFHPHTRDAWIGNFQPGSAGGWEDVLEHPNGQHIIVLSRGQGYVIDPETRQLVLTFPREIQHVVELPKLQAIAFSDGLCFEAIRSDGIWWQSPRISWDEIRSIKVDGTILRGEASAPSADGNDWVPFTLDLMTGQCEDGIYEFQMRGAIPVRLARVDKD
jgi:hypothetical protein